MLMDNMIAYAEIDEILNLLEVFLRGLTIKTEHCPR